MDLSIYSTRAQSYWYSELIGGHANHNKAKKCQQTADAIEPNIVYLFHSCSLKEWGGKTIAGFGLTTIKSDVSSIYNLFSQDK